MAEPVGFNIKRPSPDIPGDSLIFITRPSSGPFATAGTAIFACDSVLVYDTCVRVQTQVGEIVFSKDLPFLLIPRAQAVPVTTREMAELQLAEKKEYDAVFEADEEANTPPLPAVTVTDDGRLKHSAQGYL